MLGSGFYVTSYYSDGFQCEQITTQTKEINLNKWRNHNNNIKLASHQSHGDDRATDQSKQAQLKQRRPVTKSQIQQDLIVWRLKTSPVTRPLWIICKTTETHKKTPLTHMN